MANALLAGVVVFLGARLARRIGGDLAAVVAAVVLSVSPVALCTATKLYPQTLAATLMLGAMGALLVVGTAESVRSRALWAAATGILLASLALTVPNHGVTLLVGAAWLVWRLRRDVLVPLAVLLIAFSIPVGAWTVRNFIVFDEFVPVSTNGGINLLLGNTDGAGAGTGTNVDISEFIDEANRRNLGEVDKDRFLRDAGIRWIREDPVRALKLYGAKFLSTFSVRQELTTESQQPSMAATALVGITYLPILMAFLVRPFVVRWIPLRMGEGLLSCAFWANAVVTATAFTRIRFRVPIDPIDGRCGGHLRRFVYHAHAHGHVHRHHRSRHARTVCCETVGATIGW